MEDLIDTCHYGLPRAQCHLGCGRWCRPARRATAGALIIAHEYAKVPHTACGSDECCQTCSTATTKEIS